MYTVFVDREELKYLRAMQEVPAHSWDTVNTQLTAHAKCVPHAWL